MLPIWKGHGPTYISASSSSFCSILPSVTASVSLQCADLGVQLSMSKYFPHSSPGSCSLAIVCQQQHTFYSRSDGGICFDIELFKEKQTCSCFATSHGWLLVGYCNDSKLFLSDPITQVQVQLPQLLHFEYLLDAFACCDSLNQIVIASLRGGNIMLYKSGDDSWANCKRPNWLVGFPRRAILCKGKLYFLWGDMQLVMLDPRSSGPFMLVPMANSEIIKQRSICAIMESLGEVLLVSVKIRSFSWMDDPDKLCKDLRKYFIIEILRADFSNMVWVEVKSLRDQVLFMANLGDSISLSVAEVGGEGNHVFFAIMDDTDEFMCRSFCLDFNLETEETRLFTPFMKSMVYYDRSFCYHWVTPKFRPQFSSRS